MIDIDQDDIGMKLQDCLVHSSVAGILDLDLNVRPFRDFPHQTFKDRRRAAEEGYSYITIIAKVSSKWVSGFA